MEKTRITVSGILNDLENGYSRLKTSTNYNPEIGSIQEKYDLTPEEVSNLFKHEKLKGRKTKTVKVDSFFLVDDTDAEGNIVETEESTTETVTTATLVEETSPVVEEVIQDAQEVSTEQTTLNHGW